MLQNQQKISAGNSILCWLTLVNILIIRQGYISHPGWYRLAWLTIPLLVCSFVFVWRRGSKSEPVPSVSPFYQLNTRTKGGTPIQPKKSGIIRSMWKNAS